MSQKIFLIKVHKEKKALNIKKKKLEQSKYITIFPTTATEIYK
jgi:hypothetical protein